MFAKLLTLILGLGLMAGLLLVNRQRRYEIVNERIQMHAQLEQLKRRMQELKVHVANATQSTEIEMLLEGMDKEWHSIGDRNHLLPVDDSPVWKGRPQ